MNDEDRREHERIPLEMWVDETHGQDIYYQRAANISEGGLYLERTIPHEKGTVVSLQFTLPDEEEPIRVKGEVVGADVDPLGMHVRFLDVSEELRERLREYIAQSHPS
jgi:uncharacterized protein (TIGR02266 family)